MGGPHKVKRQPGFQAERSERQQARILDALTDGPKSIAQLCKIMHLTQANVHTHITRLMKKPKRRVYICGYELCDKRYRFFYEIGNKPNVTVAEFQKQEILSHMATNSSPRTALQIAASMNLGRSTTVRYINMLVKSQNIHVAAWALSGRVPVALYMSGEGDSAPRPKRRPKVKEQPSIVNRASIFAALGL